MTSTAIAKPTPTFSSGRPWRPERGARENIGVVSVSLRRSVDRRGERGDACDGTQPLGAGDSPRVGHGGKSDDDGDNCDNEQRHSHLPQGEFDGDFDDDVDRLAATPRRAETPLANGCNRALIKAGAATLQNRDVADRAVAPHDDLEHHVSGDAAAPRVVGVIGLDLAQQSRRLDAASRAEGTAARAAAGTVANAGSESFAAAGALACAGAAASSGALALTRFACPSRSRRRDRDRCRPSRRPARRARARAAARALSRPASAEARAGAPGAEVLLPLAAKPARARV